MKKVICIISVSLSSFFSNNLIAQPPNIKWWYDTHDASFGQSAAADIDGDGKLEVVFGCYRNDSSVYALNAENGTLLWKYNTHPVGAEGCNDVAPIIYDVDSDTLPEVIVPSSCNPKTFCFSGLSGAVEWQCNTRGSDSPPSIADVDNDGMPEILHGEFGGYVKCINGENGSQACEIAVDTNSWIQTAPTIADLDGNGQLDFVVGTWNFSHLDSIYAFRGDNHARMWAYPVHDYMYHGTAVADLDSDGKPELVIGSYNDTLYCINGEDGTTKWKYAGAGGYIGAPASIADLDNDGKCDVIFISSYKVTALSDSGTFKWQYVIPGFEQSFRGAALADINSDAYPDVIFGTDGGKVISLNGNNGTLIWTIDLAAHYGNPNFEFDHAPLVADFDNDDSLDVFIVGGHAEYPNFQNDFGRAYMFTAGKGYGPDWLMFQRDYHRQSSLCMNSVSAVMEQSRPSDIAVFPNPATKELRIQSAEFRIEKVEMHNVIGEKVIDLTPTLSKREGVRVDVSALREGIYFVTLTNERGNKVVRKVVKM